MASASCAGPLPPYPHSKPVGLWLRSVRRGLRGLRWLFPPITQTTHPSGPRQPAYTFLLRGRCLAVLVSAFIVLPFMGSKTPPAGRFATTGQGRRAPERRLLRMVGSKRGRRRERSRDGPLRRRERKRQRLQFTCPVLVPLCIGLYRLGGVARVSWPQCLEQGWSLSRGTTATAWPYSSNYRPWRGVARLFVN